MLEKESSSESTWEIGDMTVSKGATAHAAPPSNNRLVMFAKINVSASSKLIDFYICTKKGCKWHGLSEEDLYSIKLEESDEW